MTASLPREAMNRAIRRVPRGSVPVTASPCFFSFYGRISGDLVHQTKILDCALIRQGFPPVSISRVLSLSCLPGSHV